MSRRPPTKKNTSWKKDPRPAQKTRYPRPVAKPKETGDIPDLPVLHFSELGETNNYETFKKAMHKYCLKEFGMLGNLIETDEYYEPEPPEGPIQLDEDGVPVLDADGDTIPVPFDDENDPWGAQRLALVFQSTMV